MNHAVEDNTFLQSITDLFSFPVFDKISIFNFGKNQIKNVMESKTYDEVEGKIIQELNKYWIYQKVGDFIYNRLLDYQEALDSPRIQKAIENYVELSLSKNIPLVSSPDFAFFSEDLLQQIIQSGPPPPETSSLFDHSRMFIKENIDLGNSKNILLMVLAHQKNRQIDNFNELFASIQKDSQLFELKAPILFQTYFILYLFQVYVNIANLLSPVFSLNININDLFLDSDELQTPVIEVLPDSQDGGQGGMILTLRAAAFALLFLNMIIKSANAGTTYTYTDAELKKILGNDYNSTIGEVVEKIIETNREFVSRCDTNVRAGFSTSLGNVTCNELQVEVGWTPGKEIKENKLTLKVNVGNPDKNFIENKTKTCTKYEADVDYFYNQCHVVQYFNAINNLKQSREHLRGLANLEIITPNFKTQATSNNYTAPIECMAKHIDYKTLVFDVEKIQYKNNRDIVVDATVNDYLNKHGNTAINWNITANDVINLPIELQVLGKDIITNLKKLQKFFPNIDFASIANGFKEYSRVQGNQKLSSVNLDGTATNVCGIAEVTSSAAPIVQKKDFDLNINVKETLAKNAGPNYVLEYYANEWETSKYKLQVVRWQIKFWFIWLFTALLTKLAEHYLVDLLLNLVSLYLVLNSLLNINIFNWGFTKDEGPSWTEKLKSVLGALPVPQPPQQVTTTAKEGKNNEKETSGHEVQVLYRKLILLFLYIIAAVFVILYVAFLWATGGLEIVVREYSWVNFAQKLTNLFVSFFPISQGNSFMLAIFSTPSLFIGYCIYDFFGFYFIKLKRSWTVIFEVIISSIIFVLVWLLELIPNVDIRGLKAKKAAETPSTASAVKAPAIKGPAVKVPLLKNKTQATNITTKPRGQSPGKRGKPKSGGAKAKTTVTTKMKQHKFKTQRKLRRQRFRRKTRKIKKCRTRRLR